MLPEIPRVDDLLRVNKEMGDSEPLVLASPKDTELPFPGGEREGVPEKELQKKVEQLNQAMDLFNHKFNFEVHEKTGRVIVQVLNSETGEIVNEIPPKKILDMVANMAEAIGVIVDKKA